MEIKNKKGFTLIELIVTIAVISLLVLLAVPRLLGYTDKAVVAELTTNARAIQDASERYHLDEDDWPRLTDKPYSSEEIETFAEKIYGITGEEVNLDPNGNYYDIDFDKLESYVSVPGDKANYIIQNPVGKVYALKGLNESRFESLPDGYHDSDESKEVNGEIVFSGLDPEAWDRDKSSHVSFTGFRNITWTGDLDNKEISIIYYLDRYSDISISFLDEDGNILGSPSYSRDNEYYHRTGNTISTFTRKLIVPKGAKTMRIGSNSNSTRIHEIIEPEKLNDVEPQEVSTSSDSNSITLSWEKEQRVIIMKNGVKLTDKTDNYYTDSPLQPGSKHSYEVLFIDEYGNGAKEYVKVNEEVKSRDIVFSGLDPEAWDRDGSSYDSFSDFKNITWTGDLENKEISIIYYLQRYSNIFVSFLDKNGDILGSPSYTNDNEYYHRTGNTSSTFTRNLIVPKGTKTMRIGSSSNNTRIHEIMVPEKLNDVDSQEVLTSSDSNSITLSWGKEQRVIVMKDGINLTDRTSNYYTDTPLQPGSKHSYEVLFIDEYGNGAKEYVKVNEEVKSRDIIFSGLIPEAWDRDGSSYDSFSDFKNIIWTGDLENKEISIIYYLQRYSNISVSFLDKNGDILGSPSYTNDNEYYHRTGNTSSTFTRKLVVPKGAITMRIGSSSNNTRIHEIIEPEKLDYVESQEVLTSSDSKSITLSWKNEQRVIVMKNGVKLTDITSSYYTDSPLQPGSKHSYEVLFIDEYGNGAKEYVKVNEEVKSRDIVFSGLIPEAWDRDKSSYDSFSGFKDIIWTGDLENKEISIIYYLQRYSNISVSFLDKNGDILESPSYTNDNEYYHRTGNTISTFTRNIVVPKGATTMRIGSSSNNTRIHEIIE